MEHAIIKCAGGSFRVAPTSKVFINNHTRSKTLLFSNSMGMRLVKVTKEMDHGKKVSKLES